MSFLFVASPPSRFDCSAFAPRSQRLATSRQSRVLAVRPSSRVRVSCVSIDVPRTESPPLPDPDSQPNGESSSRSPEDLEAASAVDVGDAAYNMSNFDDMNDDTGDIAAEADTNAPEEDSVFENDWFTVAQPISKPDTEGPPLPTPSAENGEQGEGAALDLLALDDASRHVLAKTSYEAIVDVDIDDHGLLPDDDDNNELFSGVGFDALLENETVLHNLVNDLKIETATHVQLAAIPRVQDGRDLVMQSHTGTGKTLAFLLPVLDKIDASVHITQAAIIAPTRELAMQIARECERLVAETGIRMMALIGGANPARQVERLRRSTPHLVIGTPGRLAELAEARELRSSRVGTLVIDEADQCLRGEFGEQVHRLLRTLPRRVQKVLASATGDVDSVRAFAGDILHRPVLLRVGGKLRVPRNLAHWVCVVPARLKLDTVRRVLNSEPRPTRTIVFVDEPRRVEFVAERLWQMRLAVGALRGSAYKTERKEVLDALRKGKISVLVTTEVAARGLDVRDMSHVINLDLPTDADHYVHRAGRCGRAGRDGTVISIATGDTGFVVKRLARELGVEITRMEPRGGEYREVLERERGRGGERGARGREGERVREVAKKERETAVVQKAAVQKAAVKKVAKKVVNVESDEEFGMELDELKRALIDGDEEALLEKLGDLDDDDDDDEDEDEEEDEGDEGRRVESSTRASKSGRPGAAKTAVSSVSAAAAGGGGRKKLKRRQLRELAKKQEAKAKRKAAARKERRELSDEQVAAARMAKRLRRRNASVRAATERWVGNRDA